MNLTLSAPSRATKPVTMAEVMRRYTTVRREQLLEDHLDRLVTVLERQSRVLERLIARLDGEAL